MSTPNAIRAALLEFAEPYDRGDGVTTSRLAEYIRQLQSTINRLRNLKGRAKRVGCKLALRLIGEYDDNTLPTEPQLDAIRQLVLDAERVARSHALVREVMES